MTPPKEDYTGLTIGYPMSTPTTINLFVKGKLLESVDLWKNNPTGKQVRKSYLKHRKRLELKLKNLKTK